MKQNKVLCIDEEIIKKLDGINASSLVNKLLIDHFNGFTEENLSILRKKYAENKQILKESKQKDKEFKRIILNLEEKEKKVLTLSKKLTHQQYNQLKNTPITASNWEFHRKDFPNFTFSEIIKLKGGIV